LNATSDKNELSSVKKNLYKEKFNQSKFKITKRPSVILKEINERQNLEISKNEHQDLLKDQHNEIPQNDTNCQNEDFTIKINKEKLTKK